MARAIRQREQTTREKIDRARRAADRARVRLGAAARPEAELPVGERPLSWWRERWNNKAIRRTFIETHIRIRNKFGGNKLVPMLFNDIQQHLHDHATGRDVILKARKGGVSRWVLAEFFAEAVVLSGCRVRIVPHDPETENELFQDLQTMYESLPDHIRPFTRYYSKEEILFHDPGKGTVDSRITTATVQPGHEAKGRGQGLTHLHLTEVPFWRGDATRAAMALIEAAAEGRVIVESTANGIDWFHRVYQQGKHRKGGWAAFFFPWWWRSEYRTEGARIIQFGEERLLLQWGDDLPEEGSEAYEKARLSADEQKCAIKISLFLKRRGYLAEYARWDCDDVAERLAWRRAKIEEIGKDSFAVEYPENDKDCFEQTGRPVIAAEYLKVTCAPAGPVEGHQYLIAVDSSHGLKNGDPAAIEVIDLSVGRQAFEETLQLPPDLVAERVAELSDQYNGAAIVPERNGPGLALILKLVAMGYGERLYRHLDMKLKRRIEDGDLNFEEAKEEAQYGFPTTGENKGLLGLKLEESVRRGYLGLSSAEFCDEARTCVWDDRGGWGAQSGYHDDRMVALAIGNYVWRYEADMLPSFIGALPELGDAR
jgi:hypothetical protein